MGWVRLWYEMPADPKWRAIARKSGQRVGDVMSVFNFLMVAAGEHSRTQANANERGICQGFCGEDVAAALDVEPEVVQSIIDAMQGKVLEGMRLINWEKRQPIREDGSAERAKRWRESKKTQANAQERPEGDSDSDSDSDSERKDDGAGAPSVAQEMAISLDDVWGVYPHSTNKGPKPQAEFSKLSTSDVEAFLKAIPMLKAGLEADRKRGFNRQAPMFRTYVKERRWEVEMEKPRVGARLNGGRQTGALVAPQNYEAVVKWEEMRRILGEDVLRSWFADREGRAALERAPDGFVFRVKPTQADAIRARFGPILNEIFGGPDWKATGRKWRIEDVRTA